jgi:hypothetical protein
MSEPQPRPRCEKACDKGSQCILPSGHMQAHETEHGCLFFDDPVCAPAKDEDE